MIVHGEKALPELRKMANEIRRLRPDDVSTYKVMASLDLVSGFGDMKSGVRSVEEGLRIDPQDQELQSAWFYFASKDPNFNYMDFVEQNPQYPYGQYYKSAALWKEGNYQAAFEILQNLVQQYPQNEHFRETLENSRKDPSHKQNPYNLKLGLGSGI